MDTRDKVVSAGEYGAANIPGVDSLAKDKTPDAGAPSSAPPVTTQEPALAFTADEPAEDVGGEVGKTEGVSLNSLNPMNLKNLKLNGWQIAGVVAGGVAVAAGIAGVIYWRAQSRPKSTLEKLSHKVGIDRIDFSKASPRRLTHMAKSGFKHVPMPHKPLKKVRAYFG